ncbi:tRNA (adenosine(37)-N6)-threonylcarbamoyltransferase complex ATPase subunit type 1 TsaE [Patescibacteria group bacterium]|nr:tRNA (adenosine(37)-N6)-threonylcarbamoyltransferase complex ATPase subunit type 1 TsaE [Patescibacteria group bacterium]
MKTITQSERQTINLGKKLAQNFCGGEIIGLIGELGTGKTVFIKGLAQGLGIKKTITSPTFVLMKVYPISNQPRSKASLLRGRQSAVKNFVHVDAYRLSSGKDLIDIGLKDWLGKSDTVTVIEWADRAMDILPKNSIIIKLKTGEKNNERIITRH